ncbi:MAG: hypothetical protein PHI81_06550 [Synergistaceae bacterium]|nr:hypothetical protein [Synergistaceae bacterium]
MDLHGPNPVTGVHLPYLEAGASIKERNLGEGVHLGKARRVEVLMKKVSSRVPGNMEFFSSRFARNGEEIKKKSAARGINRRRKMISLPGRL